MKKIIVILLFANIATNCLSQKVTPKQLKDSILWREGYALKKEDYKAKPKPNAPVFSSVGMYMYVKESGGIVFVVETIFLKSISFMKTPSEYSFKHEQNIFDLCELNARKLRKKISEKNFNKSKNLREELNDLYTKASNDFNKDREKYEKDTEFGLNMVKQQNWTEKIAKELTELEQFASTDVEVVTK